MQNDSPSTRYIIQRAKTLPSVSAAWEEHSWALVPPLAIASFHPQSGDHRPHTEARLLHDGNAIAVIFRIEDRYVVARQSTYQSPTHKDSCVEFFVQPPRLFQFRVQRHRHAAALVYRPSSPRRRKLRASCGSSAGARTQYRGPCLADWAHTRGNSGASGLDPLVPRAEISVRELRRAAARSRRSDLARKLL